MPWAGWDPFPLDLRVNDPEVGALTLRISILQMGVRQPLLVVFQAVPSLNPVARPQEPPLLTQFPDGQIAATSPVASPRP
jgi:hypothetical protein